MTSFLRRGIAQVELCSQITALHGGKSSTKGMIYGALLPSCSPRLLKLSQSPLAQSSLLFIKHSTCPDLITKFLSAVHSTLMLRLCLLIYLKVTLKRCFYLLTLTQSFKTPSSQGVQHLIPKSSVPNSLSHMTIALPELQKLWLCCIVHHFSYQELLLLSLIDCWSQVNPDSFGSKNGPVLAFSEDFKIQDAEDSYQNLPEQEIGEELATIF